MKKIILIPVLFLLAFQLQAQINYGFQVGGSFANIKEEYDDPMTGLTETYKSNSNFGFLAGVVAEIPVSSAVSLRPELNFVQKNFSYNFIYWSGSEDIKFTTNYIEVPLNVVYNMSLAGGKFFVGGGPSLSFGINGKVKSDGSHMDIKFDGKTNTDMDDPNLHLKRTDVGFGIIVGQTFSRGFYGAAGYNFGFSNLEPDDEYAKLNTKMLTIKLGYMLPGKAARKK